tara:strand:+ start:858 stop:998 length:141 start_codon:yes stop_codon:yes gene_type:complete
MKIKTNTPEWCIAYEGLFKQIIPESPLKEAFRKWNETIKKEQQDEQ